MKNIKKKSDWGSLCEVFPPKNDKFIQNNILYHLQRMLLLMLENICKILLPLQNFSSCSNRSCAGFARVKLFKGWWIPPRYVPHYIVRRFHDVSTIPPQTEHYCWLVFLIFLFTLTFFTVYCLFGSPNKHFVGDCCGLFLCEEMRRWAIVNVFLPLQVWCTFS